MTDTHTHLYLADSFPDGGEAAVRRALEAGVERMVLPGIDLESVEPLLSLHDKFPLNTAVALGLHPTEVGDGWRHEIREIFDRGADTPIAAIGEVGIDLHWDGSHIVAQMDAFGEQIQMALDRGLPVIVHSRDALDETIDVVREFGSRVPPMVFHSFTGGIAEAERLLEAAPEAFFGINGVVTFKNAVPLREAIARLDISRIVTETDSPFLAPVPFRGKTNESAYIPYIVKAVAAIRGIEEKDMAEITTKNSYRLFPALTEL